MSDDNDQEQEDILDLCSMVEEYKECFEIAENENRDLKAQLQQAFQEIERLRIVETQQTGIIQRLDESVNQLVEEIEQNNQILSSKDADLASLQHVLGVIHKRKVEVDDQTQLQQSRKIESLTMEKNKLGEAYSLNLKILEDYLTIINQKDSEILDLTHTIKQLQLQIESGSEQEERKDDSFSRPTTATHSPSTVVTKSTRSNPSPPTSAPPSNYTKHYTSSRPATAPAQKKALFTDNPSHSISTQERPAVRRTSLESECSSDDNNEEEEASPVLPVTISRNRSTRMPRTASSGGSGVSSPTHAAGKSGGSLHSVSMNNMSSGSGSGIGSSTVETSSRANALSKYRRYVALNTTTTPTHSNNNSAYSMPTDDDYAHTTSNNNNSAEYASVNADDVDVESAYIDTNTPMDTTHSTRGAHHSTKWSDVGKHERLFDQVDIIKQSSSNTNSTNNTTSSRRKSQPTTKPNHDKNYDIDHYTHPTLHATSTSGLDHSGDSVEVFVRVESNPPSPERTKPNKLFKPPFSKPVFNEFTHNTLSKGKSGKDETSDMWAKRTSTHAPDSSTASHTSSAPAELSRSSFLFRRSSGGKEEQSATSSTANSTNMNSSSMGGTSSVTSSGGVKKSIRTSGNGQSSPGHTRL